MTTTDIYTIHGGLHPTKHAIRCLGADEDTGFRIDTLAAYMVAQNYKQGSITGHFMVPDETGTYCIIGFGDENAVEYLYIDVAAGKFHVKAAQAGPNVAFDLITTNKCIKPHRWHHFAVVQDAVKPKVYIDGVEFSLIKGTLTETDVTEPTQWFDTWSAIDGGHIGCADSVAGGGLATLEFKGYISNIKIWGSTTAGGTASDAALTQARVLDDLNGVFDNATTTTETTLRVRYDMDCNLINRAADGTNNADALHASTIYSDGNEFNSRFTFGAGTALVADKVLVGIHNGMGYGYLVQAA